MLTEDGRNQIKKESEIAGKEMQKIDDILPSENNENAILAGIGYGLNTLGTLTLGVLPSDANNGGIISQIPVLFGQGDTSREVIQVKSKNQLTQENKNDFIPMKDSTYYKNASDTTKAKLDARPDLYVSKESIKVSKENSTYQNSINGILSDEADAIEGGIRLTHKKNDNINLTVNYNPTHGALGDLLEASVDKVGGTTGMAKQTGEFVREVTTANAKDGTNIAAHSQGNVLIQSGVDYINNKGLYQNGGFKSKDYFYNPAGKGDKEKNKGIATFGGYGSAVNHKDMRETLQGDKKKNSPFIFIGNKTNENDIVGEIVGGNKGTNKDASFLDRINILNIIDIATHSDYNCADLKDARCGAN